MYQQLQRFGGREAWIAHHLHVIHSFMKLVKEKFNLRYSARHRLINFEQSMTLMAQVFGIPYEWIPQYLVAATDNAVSDADWAFEGLKAFVADMGSIYPKEQLVNMKFTATEIAQFATAHEDYQGCDVLVNTRKLGRYMKTHKTMIGSVTGIVEDGMTNNKQRFKIVPRIPVKAK
jgi:hypothetical protein